MKRIKLSQESDLTLLTEIDMNRIFSYRSMVFFILMIIFYYSNFARWFFWALFIFTILVIIIQTIESFRGNTKYSNIRRELRIRGFIR